jgi:hypothetical protein
MCLAFRSCSNRSTRQHVVQIGGRRPAQHLRGTLPSGLMTVACPVPWAIIDAGALVAAVAVSLASRAQASNGVAVRTATDDREQGLRRQLRNRLRLLMRKLKLIDDEFGK